MPGYVFKAGEPISQFASVVGVYGLSAIVFAVAASFALLVSPRGRKKWPAVAGVMALVGLYGYGSHRLNSSEISYVENVKLRIVHANIPQRDKFDRDKY